MKKGVKIVLVIVVSLLLLAIIFFTVDYFRVKKQEKPIFCVKTISYDGSKVTYWGLGYKVIRYVGVSPDEPYERNIGTKIGNWFMKYELPKNYNIKIEYKGKTITIIDEKDIETIKNILVKSEYTNDICSGMITHKIVLNNETYYIKGSCKEIQKESKQAMITDEDLNTINNIIFNILKNKSNNITNTLPDNDIVINETIGIQ